MSKRTSFVLCLPEICNALFGNENTFGFANNSIFSLYSKDRFIFAGEKEGSKLVYPTYWYSLSFTVVSFPRRFP